MKRPYFALPLVVVVTFFYTSPVFAKTVDLNHNCDLLKKSNTALLVYADWCPQCKTFKPIYEKVSNLDEFKNWIFYTQEDPDKTKVCGQDIPHIPVVWKDNMKKSKVFETDQSVLNLRKFLLYGDGLHHKLIKRFKY